MSAVYEDEIGWVHLEAVLTPAEAEAVAAACLAALEAPDGDLRVGDKPAAGTGTARLVDVVERVPETAAIVEAIEPTVAQIIGEQHVLVEDTYRCPQPGFGAQKLHADDVPRLVPGPNLCATAIVPLADFTPDNGSTRLIPGSNLRTDLQRRSGSLDRHPDALPLTGSTGDAFVFCGHTLHSGTENRSSEPRPALQFVFRVAGSGYHGR